MKERDSIMNNGNELKYRRNRKKKNKSILLVIIMVVMLAIAALLLKFIFPKGTTPSNNKGNQGENVTPGGDNITPGGEDGDTDTPDDTDDSQGEEPDNSAEEEAKQLFAQLMDKADRTAKGYDYDGAIELLKGVEDYESNTEITDRMKQYEEEKSKLVEWEDVTKVSHVFFHTLIVDTDKAFDGDSREGGYNQVMTTIDEFNKIMKQMYDRGYVLVSVHDMANFVTEEDGSVTFKKGTIMLPEGKIPFVLSQDDVSYYEYMEHDGFAHRLVIGEDGMVTNEMDLEDGTTVRGSYDMIPLLEDFIKEYPDFSYRGARGILALTGYNGVLGYRTSPRTYKDSATLAEDTKTATEVANRLKEMGWEFASHGWGHRDLGNISYDAFKWDTDMWESEVKPILGDTDIIIFPFGSDVGDWKPYKGDRYEYLKSKGFVYFCNVDAAGPYWVQITDNYLRQGRINLDGMRMYEAISGGRNRVEPFFDVESVFDKARPLPVPGM